MPELYTLRDAFAFFGTKATNPVWGWSAVSPDQKTVAVTIWSDSIGADGTVDKFGHPDLEWWKGRLGNKNRIKNLKIARENCGGLFRVVWIEAEDEGAKVKSVARARPIIDYAMKLTNLDEETREFRAIRVSV